MEKAAPHHWQQKCITKRGKRARNKRIVSAPAIFCTPEKKKSKRWTDCQMKAAMKAMEEGLTTISKAALDHNIPKTTLQDRLC